MAKAFLAFWPARCEVPYVAALWRGGIGRCSKLLRESPVIAPDFNLSLPHIYRSCGKQRSECIGIAAIQLYRLLLLATKSP